MYIEIDMQFATYIFRTLWGHTANHNLKFTWCAWTGNKNTCKNTCPTIAKLGRKSQRGSKCITLVYVTFSLVHDCWRNHMLEAKYVVLLFTNIHLNFLLKFFKKKMYRISSRTVSNIAMTKCNSMDDKEKISKKGYILNKYQGENCLQRHQSNT